MTKEIKKDKTMYPCPHCDNNGRAFKSPSGLWYHIEKHHKTKKWSCPSCAFMCGERSELKEHIQSNHKDVIEAKKKRKRVRQKLRARVRSTLRRGVEMRGVIHKLRTYKYCVMCEGRCTSPGRCFSNDSTYSHILPPHKKVRFLLY